MTASLGMSAWLGKLGGWHLSWYRMYLSVWQRRSG